MLVYFGYDISEGWKKKVGVGMRFRVEMAKGFVFYFECVIYYLGYGNIVAVPTKFTLESSLAYLHRGRFISLIRLNVMTSSLLRIKWW